MKKTAPIVRTEEIQYYLKNLKKIPVISHEREDEIFKLLKTDNTLSNKVKEEYKNEIIEGNLRFVISVAKTYQNQGLDICDLISEGNIGLIKAIDRYDLDSGYKFISYAVWWIRQSIMYSLNEHSRTIRIPSNVLQENLKKKKNSLENGDDVFIDFPTTIDLFKEINEDGDTLFEMIPNLNVENPDELSEDKEQLRIRIRQMLSSLDDREKTIIQGYFGLLGVEKNLDDLGEEFGCSKERIRQLKDKAIKKLRNESFSLLNYL